MSTVIRYFNDNVNRYTLPADKAIEAAKEWLAEHPSHTEIVLAPLREPTPQDFRPDVFDWLEEQCAEHDGLTWDGGRAQLYAPTAYMSVEGRALKTALDAYIAAHIDLSDAAWLPAVGEPTIVVTRESVTKVVK